MVKRQKWKSIGFEILEKKERKEKEKEKEAENKPAGGPLPVEPLRTFNPDTIPEVAITQKDAYCVVCCVQFESKIQLDEHLRKQIHRVAVLKAWFMTQREESMKDKYGIQVYCRDVEPLKDGTIAVQIPNLNEIRELEFIIKNNSQCSIRLRNVDFLKDMKVATLEDDVGDGFGVTKTGDKKKMAILEPGARYKIKMTCSSKEVGMYYIPLAFEFGFVEFMGGFCIVLYLGLHFSCPFIELLEGDQPSRKKPKRRPITEGVKNTVAGRPLPKDPALEKLKTEIRLDNFYPPKNMRKLIEIREWSMDDEKIKKNLTLGELDMMETLMDMYEDGLSIDNDNYSRVMASLLHLEELQMNLDIQQYDILSATLREDAAQKHFYMIDVPGLLENRPSVLRGDHVYVRCRLGHESFDSTEYEGVVHSVQNVTVKLGFSEEFTDFFLPKMRFGVRFTFSRMPMRMMHHVLENVNPVHNHLLFPRKIDVGSYPPLNNLTSFLPYNKNIVGNVEQTQAVLQILNGSARPVPYLLFGPPGTGKTMTLVEAVKQVWNQSKKSHILVCAPSNSACDTVTERLLEHILPNHILRIHASSRDPTKISKKVMTCSNYNKSEKAYFYPNKSELVSIRIIVVTLISAGRLVLAAFPINHFNYVFIDEAGQSVEPEALVPIVGLMYLNKKQGYSGGNLILAGDPKQLGPILRSDIAAGRKDFVKPCGLGKSYLERLMYDCESYQRGNDDGHFDSRVLTKLVRNYRTHEHILKLPNEMFYDGELIACADKMKVNSLCNWEGLPKKGFPLIFHGVMGRDLKEKQSPSCYNPEEVCTVINYVRALLETKHNGMRIHPKDIGIISPYRKQVQKIKWALEHHKLTGMTTGSTEEFQGQERRVIIISTVRSNADVLAMDIQYHLGFLRNAKRFNVAVTRAQALLIVIGNPYILIKDHHWGSLLRYIIEHGAYKGCHFEGPEEQAEEMYNRFERLGLIEDALDLSANYNLLPSLVEQVEGPQWRTENV